MVIPEKDFISFLTIKKGLPKSTVNYCKIRLGVINRWLGDRELTKENVEEFFLYLKDLGRNNNTLNTYRFVFRHIQDYLLDRGINNRFFDTFTSFPKTKTAIIILTTDEIQRLLDIDLTYGRFHKISAEEATERLNFTHKTICMLLAFTGCRFDEAASLRVKYLDLSAGQVTFIETKNKEIRNVYITEPLISKLKTLIEGKFEMDLVFTTLSGAKLHPTDFMKDLRRRAVEAGITKRVHPHLFRHSYATQLLMSGVDVTMVASLLGHKDIQTTYENYVHLADETLKKASHRHPLVRKNINPSEIIKTLKESVENFHLEDDSRFRYEISDTNDSLSFKITLV
jgi:integrase/recombinase XerD